MIIDWGDIIKEGLKLIVPIVGIVAPLAYQQRKTRLDAREEAKLARAERQAASAKVDAVKGELVEVKKNVDGHLSRLTQARNDEASVNVALAVEVEELKGAAERKAAEHAATGQANPDGTINIPERRKPQ